MYINWNNKVVLDPNNPSDSEDSEWETGDIIYF